MTEPLVGDERADRLARLQTRRSSSARDTGQGRRSRRAHPARGSRIAAAGLGVSATLGLATVMSLSDPPTGAAASAPPTTVSHATADNKVPHVWILAIPGQEPSDAAPPASATNGTTPPQKAPPTRDQTPTTSGSTHGSR